MSMAVRDSRSGAFAAATTPNGNAIAIASPAGLRLPNVDPGVLMTGMESGSMPMCCRRPIAATAAEAMVIASNTRRRRAPAASTTLAAQAIPNSEAQRAIASTA